MFIFAFIAIATARDLRKEKRQKEPSIKHYNVMTKKNGAIDGRCQLGKYLKKMNIDFSELGTKLDDVAQNYRNHEPFSASETQFEFNPDGSIKSSCPGAHALMELGFHVTDFRSASSVKKDKQDL